MTTHDAFEELCLSLAFGPASALEPDGRAALLDCELEPALLLGASDAELAELGIPGAQRSRLRSPRTRAQAAELLAAAERQGLHVLYRGGPGWPRRLDGLPACPRVLFARGELALLDERRMLAIVGARHATPYGTEAARAFVEQLALAGWGTYSGLARGIDGEAHRVSLRYGVPTVAVLGSGLENVYPEEHRVLAEEIVEHGGLLLSELPPTIRALRASFPRRNRLLAGLAAGVLVVEAARRSGALVTARWAQVYDRPVWAVPGPYHAPASEGCNALIRDGAFLADGPAGLLEDLGFEPASLEGEGTLPRLTPNAGRILELLAKGPRPTDVLATELELPFAALLVELQSLEQAGWIDERTGLWQRSR